MPAEFFLDTNVLIYTFDRSDPAKRERSGALVERALETGDGVVSYQVVQEFLNVALHKFDRPLAPDEAVRYLRDVLDPLCTVFSSLASGWLLDRLGPEGPMRAGGFLALGVAALTFVILPAVQSVPEPTLQELR